MILGLFVIPRVLVWIWFLVLWNQNFVYMASAHEDDLKCESIWHTISNVNSSGMQIDEILKFRQKNVVQKRNYTFCVSTKNLVKNKYHTIHASEQCITTSKHTSQWQQGFRALLRMRPTQNRDTAKPQNRAKRCKKGAREIERTWVAEILSCKASLKFKRHAQSTWERCTHEVCLCSCVWNCAHTAKLETPLGLFTNTNTGTHSRRQQQLYISTVIGKWPRNTDSKRKIMIDAVFYFLTKMSLTCNIR